MKINSKTLEHLSETKTTPVDVNIASDQKCDGITIISDERSSSVAPYLVVSVILVGP